MASLTKTGIKDIANRIMRYLNKDQITNVATVKTGDAARLLYCLDTIIQDIYRHMSWDFMQYQDTSISTTDGTRAYNIPDDATTGSVDENRIKSIILADHATASSATQTWMLQEIPYHDFVSSYQLQPETGEDSTGRPTYYMIWREKIYLHPVPGPNGTDGYSLMIHSQRQYNRLTWTNTTTLEIPVGYEQVFDAGVIAMFLSEPNERMFWQSRYQQMLDKMSADYTTTRTHSINLGPGYKTQRWTR